MREIRILIKKSLITPVYVQALGYATVVVILLRHINGAFLDGSIPGSIVVLQSLYVGAAIAISSAFRMKKPLKSSHWIAFQDALDTHELPSDPTVRAACESFADEVVRQQRYSFYSLLLLMVGIVSSVAVYFSSTNSYWLVLASLHLVVCLSCAYDSRRRLHKARALLDEAARA